MYEVSARFIDVKFHDNYAFDDTSDVRVMTNSKATFTNVEFRGGYGQDDGVVAGITSDLTFHECHFSGSNLTGSQRNRMVYLEKSNVKITNSWLHNDFKWAQINLYGASIEITNTTLDGVSVSMWGPNNPTFVGHGLACSRMYIDVGGDFTPGEFTLTDSIFESGITHSVEYVYPPSDEKQETFLANLRNVIFRDSRSGTGLIVSAVGVRLQNVTFEGNTGESAGGMELLQGAHAELSDATFTANSQSGRGDTEGGGALRVSGPSVVHVKRTVFAGNTASGPGGAIAADTGAAIFLHDGVMFTRNQAEHGGALSLSGGSTVEFHGAKTVMSSNHATVNGGAIRLEDASHMLALSCCQLVDIMLRVSEGGVWTEVLPSWINDGVTMRVIPLSNGSAEVHGTGFDAFGESLAVTLDVDTVDSTLETNSFTFCLDPGDYLVSLTNPTSGAFAGVAASRIIMSAAAVRGNESFFENEYDQARLTVRDVPGSLVITNNTAANNGAGVHVTSAELTASNLVVASNRASGDGGGIYAYKGDLEVIHSNFSGNSASGSGGAIRLEHDARISVLDSVLEENQASGDGGATAVSTFAWLSAQRTQFLGNTAGVHGGACAFDGGRQYESSFAECLFERNVALTGDGGAVATTDTTLAINTTGFYDNLVTGGNGGAISTDVDNGDEAMITTLGGAVFCTAVEVQIDWTANTVFCEPEIYYNVQNTVSCDQDGRGCDSLITEQPWGVGKPANCTGCTCNKKDEGPRTTYVTIHDASGNDLDADGTQMLVAPRPRGLVSTTFCLETGEYTFEAYDKMTIPTSSVTSLRWWGGRFRLFVDGVLVADSTLASESATITFDVAAPRAPRAVVFEQNAAPLGGGGGAYWDIVAPANLDAAVTNRNSALYGEIRATPGFSLYTASASYHAYPGLPNRETPLPIEVELRDRYDAVVLSDSDTPVFVDLDSSSDGTLGGTRAFFEAGVASLAELVIYAKPGSNVTLHVSCPTNAEFLPASVNVEIGGCPAGTELLDMVACSECPLFTYEKGGKCYDCPKGLKCDAEGLGIADARLRAGFWRGFPDEAEIFTCPMNKQACPAGQEAGTCPTGYDGPACAVCSFSEGYYKDKAYNKCRKCGNGSKAVVVAVLVVAGVTALAAFIWTERWAKKNQVKARASKLYRASNAARIKIVIVT